MKTIAIRYGLYFFASLVGLFLISYFAGIASNPDFRVINATAHLVILYYAIRSLRKRSPKTLNNYVSGVVQGMYVGFVGTLLFSIFMMFFLILTPSFLSELQAATSLDGALSPFTAAVIIFMEGVGISLIGSYLMTRYVDMRIERKRANPVYAR
ncbi:hypothetical protein [Lewinella sp. W8]|uniref:hypothetical protein n=1 Tax=Lewinella sp. W8 TaxID=2528208 RepID=UPI001068A886|nr:hypothetical protein [Lewinella sp. W8]MTB53655.1 hypothetical protein [Lewinella sp. W8]